MTAVAPPAAANPAMQTSVAAGGLVSPAAAFEAMLAAIFGQVDAQGAGLLAGGTKNALLDAPAADDGSQAAGGDASSASAQAQSLVAALFAVAPPPAPPPGGTPAAESEGSGAPAPAAGPVDPTLAALATAPAAATEGDGTAPKTPAAPKTLDAAAGQVPAPAVAADPLAAPAQPTPPAPPVPPTPPATSPAPQIAQAAEAVQLPQPGVPTSDTPPTRDTRNDTSRRAAAAAASLTPVQTAAAPPAGLAHAPTAAPPTGPAAIAAAVEAATKHASDAGDPAPTVDEGREAHQTAGAAAPAAAPPLTAGAAATQPPPVALRGAPETVANLAAQILKKLDSRSTRFDVELDPAGLGRVDVRLEIGAHGRLTAAMAFDNPQAAQELKSRSAELTRALEQAGFDVSGGLSFDVAGDRGQSGRGGGFQQDDNASSTWRGRAFQAALETTAEADVASPAAPLNLRRALAAGVDIKI